MKRHVIVRLILLAVVAIALSACSLEREGQHVPGMPSTTTTHTTPTTQPVELLPPLYQYGPTGPTEDDAATLDAYHRCLADGPRLHLVRCDIERNAYGELEVIGYPATLPNNR